MTARVGRGCLAALLLMLAVFPPVWAGEPVFLFGPEQFTRTTGKPGRFERKIVLPEGVGAPFTLKVVNGDDAGKQRVSSASLWIDGVEVVKESEFNPQVGLIEKPVTLQKENPLAVELRSNPGSFFRVEVIGTRVVPMVKKTIGPAGGTIQIQGTKNSVTVEIPADALATDTELTIRQVATPAAERFYFPGIAIGNTFSFEPHDLKFNRVVSISFTYRDEDLFLGGDEGRVYVFVSHAAEGVFDDEGGAICSMADEDQPHGPDCIEAESILQFQYVKKNMVKVLVNHFSLRTLYQKISKEITGCNGDKSAHPIEDTLEAPGFRVPVLKCIRPKAGPSTNLVPRSLTDIKRIVIHSTGNTNVTRTFPDEMACAVVVPDPPRKSKCPGFAHYYIDRSGAIVQVTEDDRIADHAIPDRESFLTDNLVTKANSIGIELFNNVGEPYHGQQITALINLVDVLIRKHPTIPRPSYPRDIKTTGIVTHGEIQENRKDPTGLFRLPNRVFYVDKDIAGCDGLDFCDLELSGVSAQSVTLFDAVVAGVSAMGGDFKGLVNTQGAMRWGWARHGPGGESSTSVARRFLSGSTIQTISR